MNHSSRSLKIAALSVSIAALLGGVSHAASGTWTGAADSLWTNTGNWLGGNLPGIPGTGANTDTATFNNNVHTTIDLGGSRNLQVITFDNQATGLGAFTINNDTLNFSAASFVQLFGVNGTANQTINSALTLSGTAAANDLALTTAHGYTGTVTATGNVTTLGASGTSQFTVRSGAGKYIALDGVISDGATAKLGMVLSGANAGTVVLRGNNTFTGPASAVGVGGLVVRSGTLLLDYANNPTGVLADALQPTLASSTLRLKPNVSAATSETVGNLIFGLSNTAPNTFTSHITLDANAALGTTLTLGNVLSRVSGFLNITTGAGTAVKTTAPLASTGSALSGGSLVFKDGSTNGGVLSANGSTASVSVTGSDGRTYIATQDASNNIVGQTNLTALPTSTGNAAVNYGLSGSLTLSGTTVATNTLRVDTSAGGTLTLNVGLTMAKISVLFDGDSDYLVTGAGALGGANNTAVQVFGNGLVTINAPIANTANVAISKGGPGFLSLGTAQNTRTGNMTVTEGVLRLTNPLGLPLGTTATPSNMLALSGGVLEIGADLSLTVGQDFSRSLTSGLINQFAFGSVGNGGFSAFSGADLATTRVVNIGGASGALTWNSTAGFIVGTLLLSSTKADAIIEIQNPISFGGVDRTIDVADNVNSTTDGAKLSGVLSSGSLNKIGAGPLELSAANTYSGYTNVAAGKLLVSGTLANTASVVVRGGSVEITSDNRINDNATLTMSGGTFNTAGHSETLAAFVLSGAASIDLGTGASILHLGASGAQTWSGGLSILDWDGLSTGGGTDQLFFGTDATGLTLGQLALINFVNPANLPAGTYPASILSSGEIVAVPEPASMFALLGGLSVLLATRRRSAKM